MDQPVSDTSDASVAAERAVIGAMLLAPGIIDDVVDVLDASSFVHPPHSMIYAAITGTHEHGEPVDVVTIEHALNAAGQLASCGGADELLRLATETPTTSHWHRYAAIIADEARRRQLVAAAAEINVDARRSSDVDRAISDAAQRIIDLDDQQRASTTQPVAEHVLAMLDDQLTDHDDGLPTGLRDVDQLLGGLRSSNFVLVGARPSMGKTALLTGIAAHVAGLNRSVLLASLEMDPLEVTQRLVAAEAKLDLQRIIARDIAVRDQPRFASAAEHVSSWPLYIDDDPSLTVAKLAARARRLQARQDLGLIVVDYLQLMSGRPNAENRQVEIAEISRALKVLARQLRVPVLAASQLHRGIENRADKRPMLADLRESGSLEQDADVVMLLYRDEVYNPDSTDRGLAEIDVAKHRNGPTGKRRVVWLAHCARFVDGTPANSPPN